MMTDPASPCLWLSHVCGSTTSSLLCRLQMCQLAAHLFIYVHLCIRVNGFHQLLTQIVKGPACSSPSHLPSLSCVWCWTGSIWWWKQIMGHHNKYNSNSGVFLILMSAPWSPDTATDQSMFIFRGSAAGLIKHIHTLTLNSDSRHHN